MKKLIILILLIAGTTFGQGINTGFNFVGISRTAVSTGVTYNARATAFFDRVTALGITLTSAQKSWYNDSIFVPLSDSGLIGTTRAGDSIAVLYALVTFPNGSETVAKLNLLDTAYSITNVNSVTFTDSGAVGGNTKYLNTNFIPSSDSSIAKLISTSYGVYNKTNFNNDGNYVDMGCQDASSRWLMQSGQAGSKIIVALNVSTITYEANNLFTSDSRGMLIIQRISGTFANSQIAYQNGRVLSASTSFGNTLVTSKPTVSAYICAFNNNGIAGAFISNCYSFAFIGSGLSADKSSKLSNILNNSLKGRNYNVY